MESRAEPLEVRNCADGAHVEVHLTGRDADGNLLFDTTARHVFQIEGGLIRRFDIR